MLLRAGIGMSIASMPVLTLGLMVEAVANSRDADDTLIIVTEDDVQDGPDRSAGCASDH
jgi:hypothetical protein